ncbi:13232_t:CDS:10, partial [Acaulospora colombiana]
CEFWLTFAEDPDLQGALHPYIPRVAPVLLDSMVYSADDLVWLEDGVEDDSAVPDNVTEIKPRHYGGRAHGLEREETQGETANGQPPTALDVLAVRFGNDLLQPLLPHLKEKLWSADWKQRECGILALGALAEGCIDFMEPHLPTLIPFLVNMLSDAKPLVRSITCWTLGRYAGWYAQPQTDEQRNMFFIPIMEGLLRMILDNNKRVQEAGCSAFATFEEEAGQMLNPFLEPVLQNLVLAFDKYQQKNLLILYDAVGTLADAVGVGMQNPTLLQILMRPLEQKWSKLGDDDDDLVPLLECLTSVTIAAGPAFANWAPTVYERCYRIIHTSLLQYTTWQQNQDLDEPDRSFIIVALDLLSGLVQGLGMQLAPSLEMSNPHLLTLHPQASVRQSGYALIGDLAMSCFEILRPHLPQVMPELINQLDPSPKVEFVSASNNAAWSAGEIALHYGQGLFYNIRVPKSLTENAAVTIGRIGLVQPEAVAPHLESFAVAWCQALVDIKDNEEKDSAFRVVRWQNPSAELNDMFTKILQAFRQMAGAQWENQMLSFGPTIAERLRARYNGSMYASKYGPYPDGGSCLSMHSALVDQLVPSPLSVRVFADVSTQKLNKLHLGKGSVFQLGRKGADVTHNLVLSEPFWVPWSPFLRLIRFESAIAHSAHSTKEDELEEGRKESSTRLPSFIIYYSLMFIEDISGLRLKEIDSANAASKQKELAHPKCQDKGSKE